MSSETISRIDAAEDLDEVEKFELNPLFYAHITITQIIKAPQLAFVNGSTDAALMSISFGVDQLESICRSNGLINKDNEADYKGTVDKFKDLEDTKAMKEGLVKSAKIANVKFEYLMRKIFEKSLKKVDLEI